MSAQKNFDPTPIVKPPSAAQRAENERRDMDRKFKETVKREKKS